MWLCCVNSASVESLTLYGARRRMSAKRASESGDFGQTISTVLMLNSGLCPSDPVERLGWEAFRGLAADSAVRSVRLAVEASLDPESGTCIIVVPYKHPYHRRHLNDRSTYSLCKSASLPVYDFLYSEYQRYRT
jgi:hypothetical protein